ncbi:hypothetical protein K2173_023097 [Erythroxylum novogranatense]|uniref:WAT1-related protein n=1 Tax=Erythroxylum novogranatense TaxID=1862640 RepID=A0AAV8T9W6_9ROSI|nr:hypothetical protein K2173_023097 [Erythroxylum novogranatense]
MGENRSPCERLCLSLKTIKPYVAIISLQFGYAGMYIVTMVSFKHGMSHYVLSVYRHVAATLIIAPFALVLERKTRPKLTLPIFLRILVLAFLEPVIDQNFYYVGMNYTSATFTSATVNILPAITFIMAIIFRLETVNFKKMHSVAKVVGTVITMSGAMVMTLYKGPIINLIKHTLQSNMEPPVHPPNNIGPLGLCYSLVVSVAGQTKTLKIYPSELSLTALVCLMGLVENAAVAVVMERDMSAWKIGFDSRLLAAAYSGIVCSGVAYYVQGVVIKERGPVFVTAFSPLCMIITAALGAIILAEQPHLGSIIGAIIIVFGLYTVVWGKSKDPLNSAKAELADEKCGLQELPITDTTKSTTNYGNGSYDVNASTKNQPVS